MKMAGEPNDGQASSQEWIVGRVCLEYLYIIASGALLPVSPSGTTGMLLSILGRWVRVVGDGSLILIGEMQLNR